ncbi:hypothetical protein KKF34_14410 [Myxococcota bacterium]|nr:hypothetical protein [Myxococcota bacterium]MBU1383131.1 hypothetical protein [Myxococcota bacterium]MBU1498066.1 hypothetical protein [Myxococcota bacterium]
MPQILSEKHPDTFNKGEPVIFNSKIPLMFKLLITFMTFVSIVSSCSLVGRDKTEDNPLLPEKKSQDTNRNKKPGRKLFLGNVNNSQFLMTEHDYMTHSTAFFENSPEGHFLNEEFHPSYNSCLQNNSDILKQLESSKYDNLTLNWCNESNIFENPLFYRNLKNIEHLAITNIPFSGTNVETFIEFISKTSIDLHLDFKWLSYSYVSIPKKTKELLSLFKSLSNIRKLKGLTLSINANSAKLLKELTPVLSVEYLTITVTGQHDYGFKIETVIKWVSEFKNLRNLKIIYNECGCIKMSKPDFTSLSRLRNLEIFLYKEREVESTPLSVFNDKTKVKFVIFDKSIDLKNIPDLNGIIYASIPDLPKALIAPVLKKIINIKHLSIEVEKLNLIFLNHLAELKWLTSLKLTSDIFNQKIMSSVMSVRKLKKLYIETTKPDGPVEMKSHPSIRSISISFSKNSEHHYIINGMPQLKYFYLNGAYEHGELMLEQKSQSNIERIDLARFNLIKKSLNFWKKQENLKTIKTLETEIPGILVSEILSLPSLEKVILKGTYETKGYYKSIIELPFRCHKIKYFSLGFFDVGNKGFLKSLGRCKHLTNVHIYNINMKDTGDIQFSPEVEITELNLSSLAVKNLKNLGPLKKLRNLTLKYLQLEKIEKLEFLNNVEDLDLTNNILPKVEIDKLKYLKNLKNLSIKNNDLNTEDIIEISRTFPPSINLDIRK